MLLNIIKRRFNHNSFNVSVLYLLLGDLSVGLGVVELHQWVVLVNWFVLVHSYGHLVSPAGWGQLQDSAHEEHTGAPHDAESVFFGGEGAASDELASVLHEEDLSSARKDTIEAKWKVVASGQINLPSKSSEPTARPVDNY